MNKLICLQAGHQNITSNCNLSLRSGTGAPGEAEFTVRVRDALSKVLISKGFQVQLVDANFNCDSNVGKDFDLFLAIHYDANVYGTGGGFVDFPEPSTDVSTIESQRITQAIVDEYFKNTGIVNVPSRKNANTKYYYMWQYLSEKTPCVILECGVGKDAHDNVILNDTGMVSNGIARGICKAFNVAFDPVTPPTPPVNDCPTQLKAVTDDRNRLNTVISGKDKEIEVLKGKVATFDVSYRALQNDLIKANQDLASYKVTITAKQQLCKDSAKSIDDIIVLMGKLSAALKK
ncbi:MAG: N-acetylmuramoyl-L-alanine amidase [Patescibacteria group bacterium]